MAAENLLSVVLVGLDEDQGDIRFNDFIQQLDIIKKALSETQKIISNDKFAYFKIIALKHDSPATITLEAVPHKIEDEIKAATILDRFFSSLNDIENGKYPDGFNYDTFNSYKDISSLKAKNRIKDVIISRNGYSKNNLEGLSNKIETIMGEDEYEIGSFTGMLDAINIHGNLNMLYIYPTLPFPRLKCVFPKEMKEMAIQAIGHYVTAIGRKTYKPNVRGQNAYEMLVEELKVHPAESELPTLSDLRGLAPNITGDKSSEEFIREIRDGW